MSSMYDRFRLKEDEDHGGELFFNERVLGPVPYRGNAAPSLVGEKADLLEERVEGKVRTFDLGLPKDLEDYETLVHRIVGGAYRLIFRHHHFDAERKCMIVYAEWAQIYLQAPKDLKHVLESPDGF